MVVNLQGEGTCYLQYEVALLPLLSQAQFDLGQSLLLVLRDGHPLETAEQSPVHSFHYLPPYPLHLFCPSFLVRKIFFLGFCENSPLLDFTGPPAGAFVLTWGTCFQRPGKPVFGELLLLFTNSVSQSVFHENTWLAMTGSVVKYWGTYIPF